MYREYEGWRTSKLSKKWCLLREVIFNGFFACGFPDAGVSFHEPMGREPIGGTSYLPAAEAGR
jgi:hypothetical protein